jgi:AcrR family transcriptional regulator
VATAPAKKRPGSSDSGRDKDRTRKALIAAVGSVLARDGFRAIGVNAVARAAGVDKVLIYRYFGGLDGLVAAYAQSGGFWPDIDELIGDPVAFDALDASGKIATFFANFATAIRKRPETLEILAWEMVERNDLTVLLESVREQQGLAMLDRFGAELRASFVNVDMQAVTALFAAATNYLAARARLIRVFNGIDITQDAGWKQLASAMETILRAMARPKS